MEELDEDFLETERRRDSLIKKQDFDKKIKVNIYDKKNKISDIINTNGNNVIKYKSNSLGEEFKPSSEKSNFTTNLKSKKKPEIDASEKKGEIYKSEDGNYYISLEIKKKYKWILLKQKN